MVYGTFLGVGSDAEQGWHTPAKRAALIGGLTVGACCLAASTVGLWGAAGGGAAVSLEQHARASRSQAVMQELAQTSARTDLLHPYGSMYPADPKFINPNGGPRQAVNPSPLHPYHNGDRPKMVQNEDFDHAPFGNHLPWENGPEGALAKYVKDPAKMQVDRFMVNKDGAVVQWESELGTKDVDPNHIGAGTLRKFSPVKAPAPDATEVAQALMNMQFKRIGRSFRDFTPKGAFHDTVVDGGNGRSLYVPDASFVYGKHYARCPAGLVRCPDASCVAEMGYCSGCQTTPMPEYCSSNAKRPSGWVPSRIGCDATQVGNCGMTSGQNLFLPGEAATGGIIEGGLA